MDYDSLLVLYGEALDTISSLEFQIRELQKENDCLCQALDELNALVGDPNI